MEVAIESEYAFYILEILLLFITLIQGLIPTIKPDFQVVEYEYIYSIYSTIHWIYPAALAQFGLEFRQTKSVYNLANPKNYNRLNN